MRKLLLAILLLLVILCISGKSHAAGQPVLQEGSTGYEVKQVQYILVSFGYVLPIDGVYGSKTKKAVQHFQNASGLFPDGIVGKQTWRVITRYIAPQAPPTVVVAQVSGDGPDAARTALRASGVDSGTTEWAVGICMRESRCKLNSRNYNPSSADDSWGPWQMNYYGSLSGRTNTIGSRESNVSSWSSAVQNFLKLYRATGKCPWQPPNYCG